MKYIDSEIEGKEEFFLDLNEKYHRDFIDKELACARPNNSYVVFRNYITEKPIIKLMFVLNPDKGYYSRLFLQSEILDVSGDIRIYPEFAYIFYRTGDHIIVWDKNDTNTYLVDIIN